MRMPARIFTAVLFPVPFAPRMPVILPGLGRGKTVKDEAVRTVSVSFPPFKLFRQSNYGNRLERTALNANTAALAELFRNNWFSV
ncbi:MAG: hypothetical protein MW690_001484 [Methanophagales archaeon]|nr:hypothetical protein [Methanophagales archaeon]